MRTVAEHLAEVLSHVQPLATENVALAHARGRVLSRAVIAPLDLPPFTNSAMDGYAVIAGDVSAEVSLEVTDDIPAGAVARDAVRPGTAHRIMTGAPMPLGADAVVPVEWTDGGGSQVSIDRAVAVGANIRLQGEDVRSGERVLEAGALITPGVVALLASLGIVEVPVTRLARVGILATGSEIIEPGLPLLPGQIYDSNAPLLRATLEAAGAEVVVLDRKVDDPIGFIEHVQQHAGGLDLLLTTGGISAGAYEVVKDALAGHLDFIKVAMQPGMPQGLGRVGQLVVIALPGNPVSVAVSFEVFVRPALRVLQGHPDAGPRYASARIVEQLPSRGDKQQYRRGWFDAPRGEVHSVGGTGSHLVGALAHSNCLIVIPPNENPLSAGTMVHIIAMHT